MMNISFRGNYIEIIDKLEFKNIEYLLSCPKTIEWVQFYNYKPTSDDLKILDSFFESKNNIYLRSVEKGMLQYLPNLSNVMFHRFNPDYFIELKYLKKVSGIDLDTLKAKYDISEIINYKDTLTELSFENDIKKGNEIKIGELSNLKKVAFISSKFESFEFLSGLNLTSFKYYGSRTTNYSDLGKIKSLKHFWLKTNTKWTDFSFIEKLDLLETIELWYCSGITKFPKCNHLENLKRVLAQECNKLEDIEELEKLKNCTVMANGKILTKSKRAINTAK